MNNDILKYNFTRTKQKCIPTVKSYEIPDSKSLQFLLYAKMCNIPDTSSFFSSVHCLNSFSFILAWSIFHISKFD